MACCDYTEDASRAVPSCMVLLAAYNGSIWLDEQIVSILQQRGVNVSIAISVDMSSDDTYERSIAWMKKNPRITVLPYGERFGGAAKNFFRLIKDVDFSNFDFVSFSDQDDIWFDSKLINAIDNIENKKIDAYSSDVTAFWSDGRKIQVIKSQPQRQYDYIFESAGPGCTFVFKKNLAIKFKLFLIGKPQANDFILHDWLLYAFARSQGFSWYIDPHSNMFYRQHADNQVGVNNSFFSLFKRFNLSLNGSVGNYINQLLELISNKSIDKLPSKLDFNAYFFFIRNWYKLRRRARDRYLVLVALILMLVLYYPSRLVKK